MKKHPQIPVQKVKSKLIRSQSEEKESMNANKNKYIPEVLSLFQINKMKKQESLKANPAALIKK